VMNHNKNRLEKSSRFLLLKKTRHERLQIKKMVRKMWRSLYWSALFCETLAIPSQSIDCSLQISFSAPGLKFVKISKRPNLIWSFSFGLSICFILWLLV